MPAKWANNFAVMEQVWPLVSSENKFRIVEHLITSDGIRTRLTNHTFQTLDEAKEWLKKKEQH